MSVSTRPEYFELTDYLDVVRRRWRIVVIWACVGALAGVGYAKLAPKTYTASALVQVQILPNNANQAFGRTSGPLNMDNEAQFAQSATVAAAAAKALHSPLPPQQLVKHVSVSVPPNSTYLQINCSQSTPTAAARCAEAFAAAYLVHRQRAAAGAVSADLNRLQRQMTALTVGIVTLRKQLKHLPAAAKAAVKAKRRTAAANLQSDRLIYRTMTPLLVNLSRPTAAGTIVTPAVAPASPSSPRLLLFGPSGLVAGLVLGLLFAFISDRSDHRIHAASDIERFAELPVLLDATRAGAGPAGGIASPRSQTGRAFIELGQYVAAALGDGNHVLLVVGTAPGTGGSAAAANLAVTLALTRAEVVLVCADARGTVTPALLGVGDGRGLSDVLAGTATVAEVAGRPADEPRLVVIPPGADAASALLYPRYDACQRLISELRREARYVIIEAQSAGEDADGFVLAEFADAALLAVEVGRTQRPDVLDCLARLDRLHTPVLGAVALPASDGKLMVRAQAAGQPARAPQAQLARQPQTPPRGTPQRPMDRVGPAGGAGTAGGVTPGGHVGPLRYGADKAALRPEPGGTAVNHGSTAGVNRGATEARPLPRVDATPPRDRPRKRANYSDSTDHTAGS
jgi:uncharacterized protein involved in exopolysaccharide biosynthesis/Mrp family chromosome partitioning ATPase